MSAMVKAPKQNLAPLRPPSTVLENVSGFVDKWGKVMKSFAPKLFRYPPGSWQPKIQGAPRGLPELRVPSSGAHSKDYSAWGLY